MSFFFFNDTATTEIYTLSLHDALPIFRRRQPGRGAEPAGHAVRGRRLRGRVHEAAAREPRARRVRSEEHTSELQSLAYLVCRLLLEKKKIRASLPTLALYERRRVRGEP